MNQGQKMAIGLSAAFLFVTVCAGSVAVLLKDKEDEEVLQTPPAEEMLTPEENTPSEEIPDEEEPSEETETPGEETPSETDPENPTAEEEELIQEETIISFNKPDKMRGVIVNAGVDFLTDLFQIANIGITFFLSGLSFRFCMRIWRK